jgi:iron complex outermembrane receptor protein
MTSSAIPLAGLLLCALCARAAIEGEVQTADGWPVADARITLPDGRHCLTGSDGRFAFQEGQGPLPVRVEHPWFRPLTTTCCTEAPLVLQPWAAELPEALVLAERNGGGSLHPVAATVTRIEPGAAPAPSSVADLLADATGVAHTGQGGLFQAYAIRGMGGQRVLSLVGGIPLVAERRAGATASFIDPSLLEAVGVVRGPYSSQYGSGALGGVVDLQPRVLDGPVMETGWHSEGNQRHLMAGTALGGSTLAVAHRRAGNSKTPDGLALPGHFEQWSAIAQGGSRGETGLRGHWLLAPALGREIGKPNTRYPGRVTRYPREGHLLARLGLERPGRWSIDLTAHPNSLETENRDGSRKSTVENRAVDTGLDLQREWALPAGSRLRTGLEWQGRRGVTARESASDSGDGSLLRATTLDGRQDELSLRASLHHTIRTVLPVGSTISTGGRLAHITQDNRGSDSVTDQAGSAFLGLTVPLAGGLELAFSAGSGYRFPGLAERWFSGSTARGTVVANAGLGAEHSRSAELGLRRHGRPFSGSVAVFTTAIDDYIERVDLADGARSYRNLTRGTLRGLELEGRWQPESPLTIHGSVHVVRGHTEGGSPLAEIPADRVGLGLSWQQGRWSAKVDWQHRFAKDDPGPGEVETGSSEKLAAGIQVRLHRRLTLELSGTNLLDRTWLPTADELAVPVPRRSLGLGLRWQG